jgi:hypothetical protein
LFLEEGHVLLNREQEVRGYELKQEMWRFDVKWALDLN